MSGDNICKEERFNEIFRLHSRELHDFLYYKYGMDNNPKDLVQEAFLKLWDNCHKILPGKARSFLFTVANRLMLNELSRRKTALNYSSNENVKDRNSESPEYLLEEKEYMEKLKTGIENLTEEQRTAFVLNRIEGKRHQEIAEMLGITAGTSKSNLF